MTPPGATNTTAGTGTPEPAGSSQESTLPASFTAEDAPASDARVVGGPSSGSDHPREESQRERVVPEEQLRWALADLDNLRKRCAREVTRERAAERARVLGEWLPIVDDLGRALEHAGDRADPFAAGVREIYVKIHTLLERLGFPAFDDIGRQFDASRHEVVAVVDDETATPGTIVATVRPGYGTPDRLLRPAGVVVSQSAA